MIRMFPFGYKNLWLFYNKFNGELQNSKSAASFCYALATETPTCMSLSDIYI